MSTMITTCNSSDELMLSDTETYRVLDLIDAAMAASAIGAFGLATEILERHDGPQTLLCVLCFERQVLGRKINFSRARVRVCQLCLDRPVTESQSIMQGRGTRPI